MSGTTDNDGASTTVTTETATGTTTPPPSEAATSTRRRAATPETNSPQVQQVQQEQQQQEQETPPATTETDSILFHCRCESARPVATLLSCLRKVSLSNNAGSGPTLSSMQEATSGLLSSTQSGSGARTTVSTPGGAFGGGGISGGGGGRNKVQYATVFVSDKSLTFQVHGIGKQSRATVDMQAGLFSEYYAAPQMVPIEEEDEEDDGDETQTQTQTQSQSQTSTQSPTRSQSQSQKSQTRMEIIRGGEFGINLTTVLECLTVLGPNALDRTKLCLSYDSHAAIFKIELLEQNYSSMASSSLNQGVIISNCAIPGMAVADDDDDNDNDNMGNGVSGASSLDYAFRSHPILARARIKSDFLRDAISELTDVSGSTSAMIGISKLGLEFATFGHSTECNVIVPYGGNHPEVFVSLESVGKDGGDGGNGREGENVLHARNYPLHSILSAMRGLEIASETCITINANGMVAIQHQVLDQVGNGDPNYVDFIMCCLEDEYADDCEGSVGVGANTSVSFSASSVTELGTGTVTVTGPSIEMDGGGRLDTYSQQQQSEVLIAAGERQFSQHSLRSQQSNVYSPPLLSNNNNKTEETKQSHDDSETETEMEIDNEESQQSTATASLFGTVANIGAASESLNRSTSFAARGRRNNRSMQRKKDSNNNKDNNDDGDDGESYDSSPRKRRAIRRSTNNDRVKNQSPQSDYTRGEESDFEEGEHSLVGSSHQRKSLLDGEGEEKGSPSSSPQLMYGDTHLEVSGDEDGM